MSSDIRAEWLTGSVPLSASLATGIGKHEVDPWFHIFCSREWIESAALHLVPKGRKLLFLALWRGDELAGWAAFTHGFERLQWIPTRTLRLLGYPLADQGCLGLPPDDATLAQALGDALRTCPLRWDSVILNEIPQPCREGGLLTPLAQAARGAYYERHCSRAPRLALEGSDATRLAAGYSSTLRTRLRRSRKKLAAAGSVSLDRRLATADDVTELLPLLKKIEDESWKGTDGVGIFSTTERNAFFRALSQLLAERGWLDIALLKLNDQAISYRYGFRLHGTFFDYNLAYRPQFHHLSPGRILLDDIVRTSAELHLTAVDACRGSLKTAHLLGEWTDAYRDHFDWWIFRPTPIGIVLNLLRRLRSSTAVTALQSVSPSQAANPSAD